jgi:MSHA biogenesis protein MshN
MSVINRVLRDLDGQGAVRPLPEGVRSVAAAGRRRRRRWPWLLALLPVFAVVAYLGLPAGTGDLPAPVPPQPAPPPVLPASMPATEPAPAVPPVPLAVAPAPAPAPAEPPVAAPARSAPQPAARPEPRSPRADAGTAAGQVVKAPRQPSPAEQAEAAYAGAVRLIEAGRQRDALARLEEALEYRPGHAAARQTAIALLLEGGQAAAAEAMLREGIVLHPDDAWFRRGLGQMLAGRADYPGALAALKPGLGQGDGEYFALYAGVLAKAGQPDAAAAAYREALQRVPDQGAWWLGLGIALERAGRRPEALAAYVRAGQAGLAPELREFVRAKQAELAPR